MKKRGKKASKIDKEIKDIVREEEKVILTLFSKDIKKRHFYSLSSIIFSIVIGLGIINSIRNSGKIIITNFVCIVYIISLIIFILLIIKKLREEKQPINISNIFNRGLAVYHINIILIFVFFALYFFIYNEFLLFKEIIFILSLSSVFGTISLHIH